MALKDPLNLKQTMHTATRPLWAHLLEEFRWSRPNVEKFRDYFLKIIRQHTQKL